jgi:hypothetical protein
VTCLSCSHNVTWRVFMQPHVTWRAMSVPLSSGCLLRTILKRHSRSRSRSRPRSPRCACVARQAARGNICL